MAEVYPFRAWRYHPDLTPAISDLLSPLFDVVSAKQRRKLYENPLNSIHLSVPEGAEPALAAKMSLAAWKENGTLVQDPIPAIYVYYQYFSMAGSDKTYIRKGFIANLRIVDWLEGILLRHESTMPFSVGDRQKLLHEALLNVSPTHGLYTDESHEIDQYLDASMQCPIYESEDYQGVRDVFSLIQDHQVIHRIMEIMKDRKVILADGHHRYESSLHYQQQRAKENPHHTGNEGYNFHMMYFTNTESEDLRILPTHRIFQNLPNISEQALLADLAQYFTIIPIENTPDVLEIIQGKKWAFGLLIGDNAYKIRLKPESIQQITWPFPDLIKELDLTILHYFIVEKILGIPGPQQTRSPYLKFERNFSECLKEVVTGETQFAVITQEISIDTIKKVCESGYTLPQKSTYFYPKVISGFLFSSIAEDEFYSPFDSCFR